MAKEIIVGINVAHHEAFTRAVENNPQIDHRNFNPHLAMRCTIADELNMNGSAQVSADVNGGPLDVRVNGNKIDQGGAITRPVLESVIEVYCPGQGARIASAMLNKGTILSLRRP